MIRRHVFATLMTFSAAGTGSAAGAPPPDFVFDSIDGGQISMADFRGHPVLVVNTASLCGFTPQYADLQALYDAYRDQGLVVLAIPSDDFRQELGAEAEVKDFCTLTYGLDLPMTTITPVIGPQAHPFYQWLANTQGVAPGWNFNKVLIGPDGAVLANWGAAPSPMGDAIKAAVEAALAN